MVQRDERKAGSRPLTRVGVRGIEELPALLAAFIAIPWLISGWASEGTAVGWALIFALLLLVGLFPKYLPNPPRWRQAVWQIGSAATFLLVPVTAWMSGDFASHEMKAALVVVAFVAGESIFLSPTGGAYQGTFAAVTGVLTGVGGMIVGSVPVGLAVILISLFFYFGGREHWRIMRLSETQRSALESLYRDAHQLARVDEMTGVMNRRAIAEWFDRQSERVTVVMLDVDNFKSINETLSYSMGDQVLRDMASVLATRFGSKWEIARLGGDEFVACRSGVWPVGTDILKPMQVELKPTGEPATSVTVAVSAGVVTTPPRPTFETALQLAEQAVAAAKQNRRASDRDAPVWRAVHGAGTPEGERTPSRRVSDALDNDEFEWWGQPIMATTSLRPIGVEILCRWRRSDGSVLEPQMFLPRLASSGLLPELGRQALVASAEWLRALEKDVESRDPLQVMVNIAPSHVGPRLVDDIRSLIPADQRSRLGIELVESEALSTTAGLTALRELREMGCLVLVDDFGSGFSTFSYLADLPVSQVKLDGDLVQGAASQRGSTVVSGLARLLRSLDIRCIAEGVENEADLEAVRRAGVEYVQGYLLERPLPMTECVESLRRAIAKAAVPAT